MLSDRAGTEGIGDQPNLAQEPEEARNRLIPAQEPEISMLYTLLENTSREKG